MDVRVSWRESSKFERRSVSHHYAPVETAHALFEHQAHGARQQTVFLFEHARRQRCCVIAGTNRNDRLRDDAAGIDLVTDEVHGRPMDTHARGERLRVRFQPGETGQQRRMDVDHATRVWPNKSGREHTHEARQNDQRRLMPIDFRRERAIEVIARSEVEMIDDRCRDTGAPGDFEARRIGPVADDGPDGGIQLIAPVLMVGRLQQRLNVAAAAGDQDNDVFHSCELYRSGATRLR